MWPNGNITRLAGTTSPGFSGDGGPALLGQLNAPYHVIPDGLGGAWIVEAGNHVVRRLSAAGTLSTLAGNGVCAWNGDGGPASLASMCAPASIALDGLGGMIIPEPGSHVIRRVFPNLVSV